MTGQNGHSNSPYHKHVLTNTQTYTSAYTCTPTQHAHPPRQTKVMKMKMNIKGMDLPFLSNTGFEKFVALRTKTHPFNIQLSMEKLTFSSSYSLLHTEGIKVDIYMCFMILGSYILHAVVNRVKLFNINFHYNAWLIKIKFRTRKCSVDWGKLFWQGKFQDELQNGTGNLNMLFYFSLEEQKTFTPCSLRLPSLDLVI